MIQKMIPNKHKGFTLIEAIVYLALLGLLMTGAVLMSYQIVQSSSSVNSKNTTQEEGNFVLSKLRWALTGLDSDPAAMPIVGGSLPCSQTLTVKKYPYLTNPLNPIVFSLSGNDVMISEGGAAPVTLTTTNNVTVSCLKFRLITGTPTGVIATTTISGVDFSITRYIRK